MKGRTVNTNATVRIPGWHVSSCLTVRNGLSIRIHEIPSGPIDSNTGESPAPLCLIPLYSIVIWIVTKPADTVKSPPNTLPF